MNLNIIGDKMRVKDMYLEERPREKALKHGVGSLSNQELLALLISTGTKEKSALDLATSLMNAMPSSLLSLANSSIAQLTEIDGIKEAKALRISACFELSRRLSYMEIEEVIEIDKPKKLVNWLNQLIGYEMQEHFVVVFLNIQNVIIHYRIMFVGTLTNSVVHPREIFREAILCGCARIICVHNHPSGKCEPSVSDIEVTKIIQEGGKLVGIEILDHLIVGRNNFCSFREMGLID